MRVLEARDPDGLRDIESRFHDIHLALEDGLTPSPSRHIELSGMDEYSQRFPVRRRGPFRLYEYYSPRVAFVILNVQTVKVVDDAGVGAILFNSLTFDVSTQILTMTSHIPTVVQFYVDDLHVRVEVSDDVHLVGTKWGL